MKAVVLTLVIAFFASSVFSQQEIRFGYLFRPKDFGDGKLELYYKEGETWKRRSLPGTLRGTIDKRSGDTLFVSMWPGLDPSNAAIAFNNKVERKDDEYMILVKDWNPQSRKYEAIKIPFKQHQFTATNIPFRVKLRDSTVVQSEFLNINIAYLFIRGKNKIYESKFVKNRASSFGHGPFLGFSTIENPVTEKDEFGFNIGYNAVFSFGKLNFVIAAGTENGFTRHTRRLNPYVGFGFGFGLIELFDPEIKTE
jgi:hypothetical protein